ncbi:TPA: TraI/MobA(P) family conjugative relaxase [Salmonella enterica subsp. enterica serovar Muenchen]|nr:relaxase/mobilization nuclease domain-containing protein [Salmonella enterica]EHT8580210.1 relaxase/mobilization nuclease domain-containing protein [Salmonella enterica]EIV2877504.1 relaxase/mobilization nuclease domain-containing protein [Salmonella enterica]
MIGRIAPKRRDGKSSFLKLVAYSVIRDEDKPDMPLEPDHPDWRRPNSKDEIFNRLLDYITRSGDESVMQTLSTDEYGRQRVLFDGVMCETNTFSLATAAVEMKAVALQNTRCIDPVLHYFLSWPVSDNPTQDEIFESVRHSLISFGMEEHQYVAAIHTDTNNIHCHIAVNRIHPVTYKAADDSFSQLKLQRALRELELKYNWTPTNGCYVVNQNKQIVWKKRDDIPVPQGAVAMEYYADQESLHSYAMRTCSDDMEKLIVKEELTWFELHKLLVRQGLKLGKKGEGLAIWSLDEKDITPIKASSLHPDLTLNCLEDDLGPFVQMEDVGRYTLDENDEGEDALIHMYRYEPWLHKRDEGARAARREARAVARRELFDRYKKYSNGFKRPKMEGTEATIRFKALSNRYAWKKEQVRHVFDDPLIRKAVYRYLEAERQNEFEALKAQIKVERDAFYKNPANRKLTRQEWVARQALKQDQAAISCLRGWSYRYKRNALTPSLSENAIICSVADDIKPYDVQSYETSVNRDGTIQYRQNGVVVIQDKGERIEIADPYTQGGQHIAGAMVIAEEKSGEKLLFSGEPAFIGAACNLVPWFNEGGEKPLPLTDPQQRMMAGYDKPETRSDNSDKFVMTHRIVDEATYLASLQRKRQRQHGEVNDNRERNEPVHLKSGKNTPRPR